MRHRFALVMLAACARAPSLPPPCVAASVAAAPAPVAVGAVVVTPESSSDVLIGLPAVLAAATSLQAFAFYRSDDDLSVVVSGVAEDGRGASCRATAQAVRCIDFAGYEPRHLDDALAAQVAAVPAPAWVGELVASARPATDVVDIEAFPGDGGPVLAIASDASVRYAVRRDRRWRLSSEKSGGKVSRPFYGGSIDTTRATGTPSIGLVLGSYGKERCVRSETVELVVMQVAETELVDLGSVVVGAGEWIYDEDGTYAPFDPKDPGHYRIELRPRVQHDGKVRFELASRHTPSGLRKLASACGVELDLAAVDRITKLVGTHVLRDILKTETD